MIMRKWEMTKILIMDENDFLPAGVTQNRWKELNWLSLKTMRLASLYDQTELPQISVHSKQRLTFRFQTSWFRDFCQIFAGFSFGFGKFGLRKKSRLRFWKIWSRKKSLGFGFEEVGVRKKSRFRFRRIWSRKKISVSENLVSKKKSRFRLPKIWSPKKSLGFGEFGLGKKFRFRNIWSQKRSLGFGFGKLDLRKEKNQITRKKLDQVNSANL